jgi:hypothetical protein
LWRRRTIDHFFDLGQFVFIPQIYA